MGAGVRESPSEKKFYRILREKGFPEKRFAGFLLEKVRKIFYIY